MRHPRSLALRCFLVLLFALLVACQKSQPDQPLAEPSAKPAASVAAIPSAPPVASSAQAPAASTSSVAPTADRPWKKALLWRIEGPKPSYLLGTIHVPDNRLEPLLPSIDRALTSSDVVMTEIPMDMTTQMSMVPKIMLPGQKTLKTELPPDLYKRVAALLAAKGLPVDPLSKLKVWALATQLTLLDKLALFASKKPLDVRVFEQGTTLGKVTGGLETPDEQVAIFDGLSKDEQVHMLRQTLDLIERQKKAGKDPIEELMTPYLAGEGARLLAALNEGLDPKDPLDMKLMKRLLTDWNKVMSDRIQAKLAAAPDKSHFFAVGAAHLVADDGIVATLKARGMKVTPVE